MPTQTTYRGTIMLTATSSGKLLTLTTPNPSPPPATFTELSIDPIPWWLWEVVQGNAGRPCAIVMTTPDGGGAAVPTAATVQ